MDSEHGFNGAQGPRTPRGAPSWPVRPESWWRRLCPVTMQLLLSGDLHPTASLASAQLDAWIEAGVTHILDVRSEISDQRFVAHRAPSIVYHWHGTEDDGRRQEPAWFETGVTMAEQALRNAGSRILVHCHMGINRGPSMALAILLAQGWDCIEAMTTIRRARPIAAMVYARDAISWFHARRGSPSHTASADEMRAANWLLAQGIDEQSVKTLIWTMTDGAEW